MYRKKIAYIEYNGNIQNNFAHYIDKPQFLETDEGFCGKLRGNKFWFFKRYPLMRNSFRTVLYGDIIDDHQICYRYGKIKWVIPFVLFASIISSPISTILTVFLRLRDCFHISSVVEHIKDLFLFWDR